MRHLFAASFTPKQSELILKIDHKYKDQAHGPVCAWGIASRDFRSD